ncbi:MAG: alpha/beta hydrolase [Gammaproteobacteria bacterium]
MPTPLESIILEPTKQADAVVIWLHGLGADGNDFVPIVPELKLPADHGIKFIFPHAPVRPITINGGMEMPGWYDIVDPQLRRDIDIEGIKESALAVRALVDAEIANGINSERIVLAGFSQGGAITYYLGLRYPNQLAGLIALSTYIPALDTLPAEMNTHKDVPIFIGHGSHDPLVPESLGADAQAALIKLGRPTTYRTYPMEHSVCLEEIEDIAAFLKQRLID